MASNPIFYFSSNKEKPKTRLEICLKNNDNGEPEAEFSSSLDLEININNTTYILDLFFNIKCGNDSVPVIDKTYTIKQTFKPEFEGNVVKLLNFMDSIKSSINDDVQSENKKLEELQRRNAERHRKNKLNSEEDDKLLKFANEQRIHNNNLKKQLKIKELINMEEDSKLSSFQNDSELKEFKERMDLIEDIKLYNYQLSKQNEQLEKEDKINFNSDNIIEYINNEIKGINEADKVLSPVEDKKHIDKSKIDFFKEKYNLESDDEIIKTAKEAVVSPVESEIEIEGEIYDHLKEIMKGDHNMIFTNIIYVITELMKFVENYNIEGPDKKTLIITSIKKLLEEFNINSPEVDIILDKICPELIDVLLLVDKRKIIIRRKLNCFIPWCS